MYSWNSPADTKTCQPFYPVIVDRAEWEQIQELLKANAKSYRGNTTSHRYVGFLTCGNCSSTFASRIRCQNGTRQMEYICKSYMHHGKTYCIQKSGLDVRVQKYAEELWTL